MSNEVEQNKYNIDAIMALAAAVESSSYAQSFMAGRPRFSDRYKLLEFAMQRAPAEGLILEFGVYVGDTINFLADIVPDRRLYGFDSFKGIPEPWSGAPAGHFATSELPVVRPNVELVVGWYDRSLPGFLDGHDDTRVAFLHIDCDLYSSTQTVLMQLRNRIRNGTIIVFDEYLNYPEWRKHEYKAFCEFISTTGLRYEYIGLVPSREHVAVRIL